MYVNQFQIVSNTLGSQTAAILMIFRVRKSNFGSTDLKFHIFSVKYGFCDTTLIVHIFLQVTQHLWKTPEMSFSHRVDILKKSYRKILSFRKVMAIQSWCFFFPVYCLRVFIASREDSYVFPKTLKFLYFPAC